MKFCDKLVCLRKEKRLSQEQLADMLEVSRQSVSKWETGSTYPEMEKLLAICKIFKCSLQEITNDEIDQMNVEEVKVKPKIKTFISEALEIVNKSIDMFRSMNFKQILIFLFQILLLVILVTMIHIPFSILNDLLIGIIPNINSIFNEFVCGTILFLTEITYFAVAITSFVYLYKVIWLDKFDRNLLSKNKKNQNEKEENISKAEKIVIQKEFSTERKINKIATVLSFFGKIILVFVKLIAIMIAIPFLMFIVLFACILVISIVLMFKGLIYIGILISIICLISLTIQMLELLFNFIVNRKCQFKKVFFVFIISLIGIGVGVGITFIDFSNIRYIEGISPNMQIATEIKTFPMTNDVIIEDFKNNEIKYIIDESLSDSLKFEIKYATLNNKNEILISKDNSYIYFNRSTKYFSPSESITKIIKDLKNNEIYNYEKAYNLNIIVYTSSKNIDIIKANKQKKIDENRNNEQKYEIYTKRIESLSNELYILREKNMKLEQKNNEYKNTIKRYNENMNSLNEIINEN